MNNQAVSYKRPTAALRLRSVTKLLLMVGEPVEARLRVPSSEVQGS